MMNSKRRNSELDPHLEVLRSSIAPSNFQLIDLVHNHQKFVGFVQRFNAEAKAKILVDRPKEALVYLTEAERILEYGASCGKNIDRNLIIVVLHNEACCYQKLWELEKCSNYLEALIFNLNYYLTKEIPKSDFKGVLNLSRMESCEEDNLFSKSFHVRVELAKYHLQFSAINSQLKNHENALKSGYKAINIMKGVFKELNTIAVERKGIENNYSPSIFLPKEPQEEENEKYKTIYGIANLPESVKTEQKKDYYATAKHYFKYWHDEKNYRFSDILKENMKNFSIGSIVQIKPMTGDPSKDNDDNVLDMITLEENYKGNSVKKETYASILNKVLVLVMGYFTIATQLRLLSGEKYKNCSEKEKKESSQYCLSEIYHIIAIIITSIYVPFDMMFMGHIYTSFANHFNSELTFDKLKINNNGTIMKEEFQKINQIESSIKKYKIYEMPTHDHNSRLSSFYDDESKAMSGRNSNRGLNTFSYITFRKGNSSIRQPESFSESENQSGKGFSYEKIRRRNHAKSQIVNQFKSFNTPKQRKMKKQKNNKKEEQKKQVKSKPKQQKCTYRKSRKQSHSSTSKPVNVIKRVISGEKNKISKQQYYESILKEQKRALEKKKNKSGTSSASKLILTKNQGPYVHKFTPFQFVNLKKPSKNKLK